MGESIHAKMNSIRRMSVRLWKIVEQYEMMNHGDTSQIAKKKIQIGNTMASTSPKTIDCWPCVNYYKSYLIMSFVS